LQTAALIEMQITVLVVLVSLCVIVRAVIVRMLRMVRDVCYDTVCVLMLDKDSLSFVTLMMSC